MAQDGRLQICSSQFDSLISFRYGVSEYNDIDDYYDDFIIINRPLARGEDPVDLIYKYLWLRYPNMRSIGANSIKVEKKQIDIL